MNIGIIAAEDDEMLAIKNIMTDIKENKIYNLNFIQGTIKNKMCTLVKSGVGKVNAARTTQIIIDKWKSIKKKKKTNKKINKESNNWNV